MAAQRPSPRILRKSVRGGRLVLRACPFVRASDRTKKPFILDAEWADLHREFHQSLLAACNSPKLLHMRETLFYQAERYWHLWAMNHPAPPSRGSNHDRLRDAVLERDIVRSSDLLKNHISQTTEIVVKYLEQE